MPFLMVEIMYLVGSFTLDATHPSGGYAYVFANYDGTIVINDGSYKIGDGVAKIFYVAYGAVGNVLMNGGTYTWIKGGKNVPVYSKVTVSDDCIINW